MKLLGLDGVEVFQGRAFETNEELGNRIVPRLPKENLWIIKEQKKKINKKCKAMEQGYHALKTSKNHHSITKKHSVSLA